MQKEDSPVCVRERNGIYRRNTPGRRVWELGLQLCRGAALEECVMVEPPALTERCARE